MLNPKVAPGNSSFDPLSSRRLCSAGKAHVKQKVDVSCRSLHRYRSFGCQTPSEAQLSEWTEDDNKRKVQASVNRRTSLAALVAVPLIGQVGAGRASQII
jgi:hypothetical protein